MRTAKGFTLIELLIVIALVSLLSGLAISSYQGYVKEARFNVAKLNARSLRIFLEDYHVHHATYIVDNHTQYTKTTLNDYFGWQPNGDDNQYTYTVTPQPQSWDIVIQHTSGQWVRCENRMQQCCDSDTPHATLSACASGP